MVLPLLERTANTHQKLYGHVELRGYKAPIVTVERGHQLFYFVFRQEKDPSGSSWLLLGRDRSWRPESPSLSIKGWAPAKNFVIWPGRQAVGFRRSSKIQVGPYPLFATWKAAKCYMSGEEPKEVVAWEDPRWWHKDDPLSNRFPVLGKKEIFSRFFGTATCLTAGPPGT